MNCACVGTWKQPCIACYRTQTAQRNTEATPQFEEYASRLKAAGAPDAAIRTLADSPRAMDALTQTQKFVKNPELAGNPLLLLGSTGRGKTVAAVWAMLEVLRRKGWNNTPTGATALPVQFLEASQLTGLSNFEKVDRDWLNELALFPLLVVDDAGDEASPSGCAGLATLLLRRAAKPRRSILTSNLRREGFEQRYGKALLDRCIVVECAGKSLRPKPETRAP